MNTASLTDQDMDNMSFIRQSMAAISHTLGIVRDNPHVAYQMGVGTQAFALLTKAAADLFDEPVDEVRKNFRPRASQPPGLAWASCEESAPLAGYENTPFFVENHWGKIIVAIIDEAGDIVSQETGYKVSGPTRWAPIPD